MLATAQAHGFTFDAVQLPLNVMDAHFDSFARQVVPRLVERDIAVLGMKPMGDPFVLVSGTVTAVECLHYAMEGSLGSALHDLAQRLLYSSWRRHQVPVSLRPLGARSSHWYMPQRPSRPRA